MMEEEKSVSQSINPGDNLEVDNNYQDQSKESKSFDGTHLGQRRCAVCGTPLTSYDFHGFNVLHCKTDDKPVCRICRHPSIELVGTHAIHCTNNKCPTYQVINYKKDKADGKGNESIQGTKKPQ